jgi:hypothetical protein
MSTFLWATREEGHATGGIDVSSYGSGSYKKFSPFSNSPTYRIPVPGNEQIRADSVEGTWQGLKIISGRIEPSLFKGRPRKREGKPEGHQFDHNVLNYIESRKKIYLPAYIYHVINNALPSVSSDLESKMREGPVTFYDVESNNDIDDGSAPYSHAALLADVLNVLKDSPLPPFNKQRFTYLDEEVDAAIRYRETLSEKDRKLLDETITFAYLFSPSELHKSFALKAIRQANIESSGRLRSFMPSAKTAEDYAAALTR